MVNSGDGPRRSISPASRTKLAHDETPDTWHLSPSRHPVKTISKHVEGGVCQSGRARGIRGPRIDHDDREPRRPRAQERCTKNVRAGIAGAHAFPGRRA